MNAPTMKPLSEFRARTQLSDEAITERLGKMLSDDDYDILITGHTRILRPDGRPLCVLRPKAIPQELRDQSYPILHSLKNSYTENRGLASGSQRVATPGTRTRSRVVDSAIIGSFDPAGQKRWCRLTAWTGKQPGEWQGLWPLFQNIAEHLKRDVPERYAAQAKEAAKTSSDWVIPGTPFTTITVNNSYATGCHFDKGDLDAGFSTIACFRNGDYEGGRLVFPQYRVAVDLQDRDLLLMDAHCAHGNTSFNPDPERDLNGHMIGDPGFERISVVCYYRTKMTSCGSAEDENQKALAYVEQRHAALLESQV